MHVLAKIKKFWDYSESLTTREIHCSFTWLTACREKFSADIKLKGKGKTILLQAWTYSWYSFLLEAESTPGP